MGIGNLLSVTANINLNPYRYAWLYFIQVKEKEQKKESRHCLLLLLLLLLDTALIFIIMDGRGTFQGVAMRCGCLPRKDVV